MARGQQAKQLKGTPGILACQQQVDADGNLLMRITAPKGFRFLGGRGQSSAMVTLSKTKYEAGSTGFNCQVARILPMKKVKRVYKQVEVTGFWDM